MTARDRAWRSIVLLIWAFIAIYLSSRHAFWRDEVRAYTFALDGGWFWVMSGGFGDGHPPLWHVLLKSAYSVFPTPMVLPAVALIIAVFAFSILLFQSPFSPLFAAMFIFGRIGIYEYSVMARNYGISMLLMFAFAALYQTRRSNGPLLGFVLALLALSNVHSILLVLAILMFWGLELAKASLGPASSEQHSIGAFAVCAAISAVGILASIATVYPTVNDAAQIDPSGEHSVRLLLLNLLAPGESFGSLSGYRLSNMIFDRLGITNRYEAVVTWIASLLVFGSILTLGNVSAALSALFALTAFSSLSVLVHPASYRHQALWLVYLICLIWMTTRNVNSDVASPRRTPKQTFGKVCLGVLLVAQIVDGGRIVSKLMTDRPESRSREVANLISRTPGLKEATIIAVPDYLIEPLPYYIANRTYLIREQRFGRQVVFSKQGKLSLDLDAVTQEALALSVTTERPVVILMMHSLDPTLAPRTIRESYNWRFTVTPEQIGRFAAIARLVAQYERACCTDESFDVYVVGER